MAKKKAVRKKAAKAKAGKKSAAAASRPATPVDLARAFRESYAPPAPAPVQSVMLDADVAPHFRSERAVNEALRALLRIVKQVRSQG